MAATYQEGHIYEDKRRPGRWYVMFRIGGKQKKKALGLCGSEKIARKKAAPILQQVNEDNTATIERGVTLGELVKQYKGSDRFPARFSTKAAYTSFLDVQILPQWEKRRLKEIRPKEVETWLKTLKLAGKTKGHLKMLMHRLFKFAMMEELFPHQENPMKLVEVRGSSKRVREPLTLTADQFHQVISGIHREPFKMMAITAMCLGLRYSELIGLKWGDVDWIESRVHIRRGVVNAHVDETKTADSNKPVPVADALIEVWKRWRLQAEFKSEDDWMFASPQTAGTMPYCYPWARKELRSASSLEGLGWHSFRHSYRSWLNSVGATPGVQKDLMRHSDIKTTMNVYGAALTEEMREAHGKVVGMVLRQQFRR